MLSSHLIGLILCAVSVKGHPRPYPENLFLDPEQSFTGGDSIDGGAPFEVALAGSNSLETNPFTGGLPIDGGASFEAALAGSNSLETNQFTGGLPIDGGAGLFLPDNTGLIPSDGYVPGSGEINFNQPLLLGGLPTEQSPEQLFETLPDLGTGDPFSQPETSFNLDSTLVPIDGSNSFELARNYKKPYSCKSYGDDLSPWCCDGNVPGSCDAWSEHTSKCYMDDWLYCCKITIWTEDGSEHRSGTCEKYTGP